jgi:hypothetical protein
MTWTKLSDDYGEDHFELSDKAFRLHVTATIYCNRHGLDGALPEDRLRLLPIRGRRKLAVDELEGCGLWRRDVAGWVLTDFFDAQLSAEEVELTRKYDALRSRLRLDRDKLEPVLRPELDAVKVALFGARERRKSRSHIVGHSETPSARPDPIRPARVEIEGRQGNGDSRSASGPRSSPESSTETGGLFLTHKRRSMEEAERSQLTAVASSEIVDYETRAKQRNEDRVRRQLLEEKGLSITVDCRNYNGHRFSHHRPPGSDRFVCDVCSRMAG